MSSLGEEYPKQQARMRTLLKHGRDVGPAGIFYCAMIEDLLQRADRAAMEQDVWKMAGVYQEMKDFKE